MKTEEKGKDEEEEEEEATQLATCGDRKQKQMLEKCSIYQKKQIVSRRQLFILSVIKISVSKWNVSQSFLID